MSKKCRSCILAKENYVQLEYELINKNFICLLCDRHNKWYSHITDKFIGDALECENCHNYIIYTGDNLGDKIWKDEIYIPSVIYCVHKFY